MKARGPKALRHSDVMPSSVLRVWAAAPGAGWSNRQRARRPGGRHVSRVTVQPKSCHAFPAAIPFQDRAAHVTAARLLVAGYSLVPISDIMSTRREPYCTAAQWF
jgi:hypothetical protein